MKKNELEQNIMLAEQRLLELGDRISALEQENEVLRKTNEEIANKIDNINEMMLEEIRNIRSENGNKVSCLSEELYGYIGNQVQQLNEYIDMLKKESDNKTSSLSEELYEHIGNQVQQLNQYIDMMKCESDNKSVSLSEELYEHIGNQVQQLNQYVDMMKQASDNKSVSLSNELYQHIANVNTVRDENLEKYKKQLNDEFWMRTFGFDNMISELQLAVIEKEFPGNRARLEALKDTHKGEKCFVIGNGPSLTAADLDKLKEKNIFCFASKGIFNIFDETDWRPDVWGVSDLDYIKVEKDNLNNLIGFKKLVCAQAFLRVRVRIEDAIYYPFIQAERTPKFFNKDVTRGVHFYGTITGKLINFAAYMGFSEIYLLGCDNSLPLKKDSEGKVVVDTSRKCHFTNKYYSNEIEEKKAYENIGDIVKSLAYTVDSYKDIKYHCDLLNVKIYNATRGGELEVFPRVNFDEVVGNGN